MAVERLMGILSLLGLPIPGHLQLDVDSAHPVIDLPVAEILQYIAAGPRREVFSQARSRSLLDFRNDIAEYRRNIAGVELLHCRELLLQSDQLIAKTKIFCVPSAVFGTAGLLDLALMKRTPRAQMG
jgi:hypothetical protein